jgi:hypothetical protein
MKKDLHSLSPGVCYSHVYGNILPKPGRFPAPKRSLCPAHIMYKSSLRVYLTKRWISPFSDENIPVFC